MNRVKLAFDALEKTVLPEHPQFFHHNHGNEFRRQFRLHGDHKEVQTFQCFCGDIQLGFSMSSINPTLNRYVASASSRQAVSILMSGIFIHIPLQKLPPNQMHVYALLTLLYTKDHSYAFKVLITSFKSTVSCVKSFNCSRNA